MRQFAARSAVNPGRLVIALMTGCLIGWGAPEAGTWEIRSEDPSGERFRVTVTPAEPVREAGPGGMAVSFPGPSAGRQAGAPDLGCLVQTIPGRPGFHAVIRVIETESRDEPGRNVIPAEITRRVYADDNVYRSEKVRQPDPAIYADDAFWPPTLMRLDEAWMGTNKYVRLVCWPAQYNPVKRVLRVHTRITGELCFVREGETRRGIK